MQSVIFDLDGTLADTSDDLLEAANSCFRRLGFGDVLTRQDAGIALRGGKRMLTEGLKRVGHYSPELVEQNYPLLLDAYAQSIAVHSYLYDGAMSAIEQLKSRGVSVGVCTNKPEALARQLLIELGVLNVFGALIGADTLPVRKPDPAPLVETARRLGAERYLLVGDSDTDRNTALAAQVPCILVTFGPSGDDMAQLKPDALLAHYKELPDIANELLAVKG